MSAQRNRIHPYKFNMWVAMGSIVMFFAAFTSAYIVMHARNNWVKFPLPKIFWFSTAIIIISSLTMHLAVKNFKDRNISRYKLLMTTTAILGLIFMISQSLGFSYLYGHGVKLDMSVSAGLLFIITGAHMLHVLGGVIALIMMFIRAFRKRVREYSSVAVEVVSTYWHFVDILWIYLFIFFLWIR